MESLSNSIRELDERLAPWRRERERELNKIKIEIQKRKDLDPRTLILIELIQKLVQPLNSNQ